MKKPVILIAGVDEALRRAVKGLLIHHGCEVTESFDSTSALRSCQNRTLHLVILGPSSGDGWDGLDLAREIRSRERGVPLILITEDSSEELAIAAIKIGVNDYFKQPCSEEELFESVTRLLSDDLPSRPPAICRTTGSGPIEGHCMIGESRPMRELRAYIPKVARADCSVLIVGETGTGKELVADLIHRQSSRRGHPFVCINCAAIPDTLLESELFGFERGAFTGAYESREGKLRQAQRGTVLLDEIGDMSLSTQAKILRVIENREVQALGGRPPARLDVRVIAASNRELEAMIQEKSFRRDLFYRLSVATVRAPALREHKEDIPLLLQHFISEFNGKRRAHVTGPTPRCLEALASYAWPGNVRELRNLAEAIFVEVAAGAIDLDHLPDGFRRRLDAAATAPASERDRILSTLLATNWNKSSAAQKLHWSRMTLYRKMAKHHLVKGPKPGDTQTTVTE